MKKNKAHKAQAPSLAIGPRIKIPFCHGCGQLVYLIADAVHNCPGGYDIEADVKLKGWKKGR